MANTIAEYGYLATDVMLKGIVKTIINESPFLARMPFREVAGNSLLYNLESAEAGVGNYAVGDTWVEGTPTWAQRSVALTIIGGDADVDSFAKATRSNEQDVKASIISLKAKAVADHFEKQAIRGYTGDAYSTKDVKGLMHLLAECEASDATDWDGSLYTNPGSGNNTQVVTAHATSAPLTLIMLDVLRDLVKPKPDVFVMSRMARQYLAQLARAEGSNLEYRPSGNQLGHIVPWYGEQEILISDFIPNYLSNGTDSVLTIRSETFPTTRASGNDNTVIFALRFSDVDGVAGVTNGWITKEEIGKMETKDAERTRIKFYCNMANFGKVSLAALINVVPGTEL